MTDQDSGRRVPHVVLPVLLWILAITLEPWATPVAALATVLHSKAFLDITRANREEQ